MFGAPLQEQSETNTSDQRAQFYMGKRLVNSKHVFIVIIIMPNASKLLSDATTLNQ